MSFSVGQKVVCVNNSVRHPLIDELDELSKGSIYTVRWIGMHACVWNGVQEICVRLCEIKRPPCEWSGEDDIPYRATRFRPLTERKASIEARRALFDRWLVPERVKA